VPHDRALRLAAKQVLKRPAVEFTGIQARAVGRGFANYFQRSALPVWACAILPDHVHLVVAEPKISVKQLVIQLKGEATQQLISEGIHPFGDEKDNKGRVPKCFARGEWKVFLDPDDVPPAIEYVEANPEKEGKPRQRWLFVTRPGQLLFARTALAATRRLRGAERGACRVQGAVPVRDPTRPPRSAPQSLRVAANAWLII
jgi:REP element-mobilizing transposase RayT